MSSRVTRSTVKCQDTAPKVSVSSKGKPNKAPTPDKSTTFYSNLSEKVWAFVVQRKILSERLVHDAEFKEIGVFELLKEQNLLGTVTKVQPFVKNVVLEFYANLVKEINNPAIDMFHKVFVRGHFFDFSPAVINEFLESHHPVVDFEADYDVIIAEITANVRCKWPPAKSFPALVLSLKYSVLHKIALKNWMPSMHATGVKKPLAKLLYLIGTATSFDFGQFVFNQIINNAEAFTTHPVLSFPSLIYGILSKQNNVKKSHELFEKGSGVIRISKKLHSGKYVDDVQGEHSGVATSSSQLTTAVLNARTAQFLSKEPLHLSTYETHLLQELKRVGCKKKEITAILGDIQSSSVAAENDGA
ncbi:uncharacterized protein LOC112092857 [Morus notabilis]|uniref:uncharacterized protein LOC112092857 n=1 Tax=Morus notabilis TaxID=981085 RepID=UPI000CED1D39|nr:uncharacterized protein LOC112092857 [Morus notabilis]